MSDTTRERLRNQYLEQIKRMSPKEKEEFVKQQKTSRRNGWKKSLKNRKTNNGYSQPKISLETKNKRGTCPDQLLDQIKKCKKDLGKAPSKKEFIDWCGGSQRFVHCIYATFGSWKKALDLLGYKVYRQTNKGKKKKYYSNEELIEYLQIFTQEHGRQPTYMDFNRGLLPNYQCYLKRWGSIAAAREAACLGDFLTEEVGCPATPTSWAVSKRGSNV